MKEITGKIWQILKEYICDFVWNFLSLWDWRNDNFSCQENNGEKVGFYRILLAAAVLLGAFLRIFIFYREPEISRDAVYYLTVAEIWHDKGFSALLQQNPSFYIPPVMPGLIVLFVTAGMTPLFAGVLLNLLTGILLIPLFYLIGKFLFDSRKAGVTAAFLASFNPVLTDCSVDVTRENCMLFFMALFLLCMILGLRRKNIWILPGGFTLSWSICSRYEAAELLMLTGMTFIVFALMRIYTIKKLLICSILLLAGLAAGFGVLHWIFGIPIDFYMNIFLLKIRGCFV